MGTYKTIDHTADIAIEISGSSLEDLFHTAWQAWYETVLGGLKVHSKVRKNIKLRAATAEELLVNFLGEVNYWLLVKKWIPAKIEQLEFSTGNGLLILETVVSGQSLNSDKHELQVEVKAVTFHQMEIKQFCNNFSTRLVFDV